MKEAKVGMLPEYELFIKFTLGREASPPDSSNGTGVFFQRSLEQEPVGRSIYEHAPVLLLFRLGLIGGEFA